MILNSPGVNVKAHHVTVIRKRNTYCVGKSDFKYHETQEQEVSHNPNILTNSRPRSISNNHNEKAIRAYYNVRYFPTDESNNVHIYLTWISKHIEVRPSMDNKLGNFGKTLMKKYLLTSLEIDEIKQ